MNYTTNTNYTINEHVPAIVQCIRMCGPMLGYVLASYTLTKFIDLTLTPIINDTDPRWVGAWWLGE